MQVRVGPDGNGHARMGILRRHPEWSVSGGGGVGGGGGDDEDEYQDEYHVL